MSEPENFLKRWSRRKRETDDESPSEIEGSETAQSARVAPSETLDSPESKTDESGKEPAPFDVSSLPPIESIGAQSDVRAFMQPGVPYELRHAALRRAWSADPQIRDYIGPVENGWNFNDPYGVPGFGPMPEGEDIAKLLAQAIGIPQPDTARCEDQSDGSLSVKDDQDNRERNPSSIGESGKTPGEKTVSGEHRVAAVQSAPLEVESHVAPQKDSGEAARPPSTRRTHGGALPR